MTTYKLLIGGKLVSGAMTSTVINPATEDVLAIAPRADLAQLHQAVAAAKAAFPVWSATPIRMRGALLTKLADAMEARQDELARLLTEEQGKPLAEAKWEIVGAIASIRYFASLDLPPKVLREDAKRRIVRERVPLGVIAAITPWNVPIILLATKIAAALLAGNTVVAKPAATTPLTTLRIGELCAGILPPGVINIIADQNDLGSALTGHPDVAKVTFTGSTATGKKVMESAAGSLKRLTLELGGNDAAIVLDDVDPKEVAPKLLASASTPAKAASLSSVSTSMIRSTGRCATNWGGWLARSSSTTGSSKEPRWDHSKTRPSSRRRRASLKTRSKTATLSLAAKPSIVKATSCNRRSYAISPMMRGWSRRSSSAQSCRCCAIPMSMTQSRAQMIRISGSAAASGQKISIALMRLPHGSSPARCGSTSISICIPRCPLAAPKSPVSGLNRVRKDWKSSPVPKSLTWRCSERGTALLLAAATAARRLLRVGSRAAPVVLCHQ